VARKESYEAFLSNFATNLKKIRKERGLTQEEMAPFNYRFYQRLESGKYSPSLKTVWRLAKLLKVDFNELFI
jgi:DNA-binding XRE family transcriptional regulator